MANTVTSLSNANTFGHWLVTTNELIAENNILAKDNYVKDSGTIYLSEGTLTALQSNGNVIIQKALSVSGPGSSTTIEKDLTVQRQGLFTNTGLSLATSGSANIANVLNVLGAGYGLRVQNDARVGGDLYVGGDLDLNILEAREKINTATLSVTGTSYTSKLQSNNQVVTEALTANSNIYTSRLQSNTSITTTELQANTVINAATISVTTGMYGNSVQANSSVNTSTASIVNSLFVNKVQANTSVNTSAVSVSNGVFANNVVANSSISATNAYVTSNAYVTENLFVTESTHAHDTYTANTTYSDLVYANTIYNQQNVFVGDTVTTSTLSSGNVVVSKIFATDTKSDTIEANNQILTPAIGVEGTTFTRFLQANSSTNTSNSSVVNTSYTKYLVANTLVTTTGINVTGKTHTNTLQANTSANTETLSVSQRAILQYVQANTAVNTEILSVTTTAFANKFQANSSVNTSVISVTGNTYTDKVQANTSVNTATLFVTNKIDANDASVFVNDIQILDQLSVGGNFVINGETIYNSNVFTLNAGSTEGQISSFVVNRGQTGANAVFRWNESSEWWDILNTNEGNYYKVLTREDISDVLNSTNGTVAASSVAANTLNDKIETANTFLQGLNTTSASFANGAFNRANSGYNQANSAASFANGAFARANASFAAANNVFPQIQPSFDQANAAFNKANSVISTITGTSGYVNASAAGINLKSNNGIVVWATNDGGTGNTLTISTPQDLRTTASPSFASLSLTTPLGVGQGGTATTSHASLFDLAIYAAAGAGAAGKVLSTDGNRNYSWVTGGSGGSGGGTQPGSRITSSRLSYTGDDLTSKFTTPTFSTGTQLRAYINGVRQLESEYNAFTSNSIISFNNTPVTGDKILVEVDGYAVYEYFANNIAYGPVSGDMVGTTIQAAIDNLETRKAALKGAAFTGQVTGITLPTGTANTSFATTDFVAKFANASYTLTSSITGNAGTVTNGVYSNLTYDNPSWITGLANTKISGTIADGQLINAGPDVNAYVYGTASKIAQIKVDGKGRVRTVANVDISITKSQISDFPTLAASATTDTTSATNITSGTLPEARLGDQSGITAQAYGGAAKVATFTVNKKGLLTAAGESQISITKAQVSDFPSLAASATTDTTDAANITKGTLAEARLPASFAKLGGADFTGSVTVSDGKGKATLATSGDITAYRDGGTTGVIFLNSAQTRYLYWNGTNYVLNGAGLTVNGTTVLNTSDSFDITGTRNYKGSSPIGTLGQSGSLVCYGDNSSIAKNVASMSFHRPGSYAINMGLDTDNVFRIGGWSDNTGGASPVAYYRMTLDSSGAAVFRNNVTAYSDARLKTDVKTIENAVDTVSKMRGVSYERIDTGERGIGVIAQEMKEVLPEVVMDAASENEYMSVSYGNIVGVLIEAIKELKAEIEVLKGQINDN